MSYKKSNKQSKSMGKGMQALCIILALVLIAAAVITVLQFCTPYKPSKWFKKDEGEVNKPLDEPDDNTKPGGNEGKQQGSLVETDRVEAVGIALYSMVIPQEEFATYGVSPQAQSARELEIVFSPETATDKSFTVQTQFKGDMPIWSNGKEVSDYLTAEPSMDDKSKVIVTNLAPFGDRITVTIQSVQDPEKEVSLDYGYCAPLEGFNTASYIRGKNEIKMMNLGADTDYHLQMNWGVGTETGETRLESAIYRAYEEYFWGPVKSNSNYVNATNVTGFSGTVSARSEASGISLALKSGGVATGTGSLDGTLLLSLQSSSSNGLFQINGGGNMSPVVANLTRAVYEVNKSWQERGTGKDPVPATVTFTVRHIVKKAGETDANAYINEVKTLTLPVYYLNMDAVVTGVSGIEISGDPDTIF